MDEDKHERLDLLKEHIASRRDYGAYLDVVTELHRATVARTDDFVAHVWARLEQTKDLSRSLRE